MTENWNYLCTDREFDGEDTLLITYYERVKNVYGMVATIEIGRQLEVNGRKFGGITTVRTYTKSVGGIVPWREFTLADFRRIADEDVKSSSKNNKVKYQKTKKDHNNAY